MKNIEWTWQTIDGLKMYSKGWLPENNIKGIVFLVHGLGEHINRYAHVAEKFVSREFALIGFDLRGHGKSDGQRGHIPSQNTCFDDLDVFLQQIHEKFPGIPVFMYGHSMGGILVLAYPNLRKPDIKGVVATAASLSTSLANQKGKVMLAKVLGTVFPTFVLDSGLVPSTLSRDENVVKAYVNDPLVHHKVTTGWGKFMLDTIAYAKEKAKTYPFPILLMHGSEDVLGYAQGSQDWYESAPKDKASIKIWEGLFHEIHNEPEKDQVLDYMIDWLER